MKKDVIILTLFLTLTSMGQYGYYNEPVDKIDTYDSAVDFLTMKRSVKKLTTSQFENYVETLKGKQINWTGWIDEVDTTLFGKCVVLVDMEPPYKTMSTYDVSFVTSKKIGLQLMKDEKVQFVGEIEQCIKIFEEPLIKVKIRYIRKLNEKL